MIKTYNILNIELMTRLTAVLAMMLMVSCASDDVASDEEVRHEICFAAAGTEKVEARGGVSEARGGTVMSLSEMVKDFTVYGVNGMMNGGVFSKRDKVYDNYVVWYDENGAGDSETNSNGWEYVGSHPSMGSGAGAGYSEITASSTPSADDVRAQRIKYWDYSKDAHLFWAVAKATEGTFTSGTGGKATFDETGLVKTFITDVSRGDDSDDWLYYSYPKYVGKSDYNKAVALTFVPYRSLVRVGFYSSLNKADGGKEIHVVDDLVFYKPGEDGKFAADGTAVTDGKVYLSGNFLKSATVTLTYSYDNISEAGVSATATHDAAAEEKVREVGEIKISEENKLDTTSYSPTWAGDYIAVLPNTETETGNSTGMITLKCDYTIDGTTKLEGKMATIPAKYTQWEPGKSYTYIFKITESEVSLYDVSVDEWQSASTYTEWHNW